MTIIVLLNFVFAVLVVGGILTLLGWGIASDHASVATLARRQRAAVRMRRQSATRFGPAASAGA